MLPKFVTTLLLFSIMLTSCNNGENTKWKIKEETKGENTFGADLDEFVNNYNNSLNNIRKSGSCKIN